MDAQTDARKHGQAQTNMPQQLFQSWGAYQCYEFIIILGLDARKPIFRGLRTKKVQTSLHICAPLLLESCYEQNFNFLCSS